LKAFSVIKSNVTVKNVKEKDIDGGSFMSLQHRLHWFDQQPRAYTTGTVEYIHDQWVFFEDECEEASLLDDYLGKEVEVFHFNQWVKGVLREGGILFFRNACYHLQNGDAVRFRKILRAGYQMLLDDLSDEAFLRFAIMLNQLSFSLYDCIYCYHHSMFQHDRGVNFLMFDNTDTICSVQHHYQKTGLTYDRFEFTLANGKRALITLMRG
jgi:Protein of unknown function (DUF2777)